MKLVIVESPTKAKTISKFLGKEYDVQSSFGHVRDLPKSKIGVDTEHNFEPQYIIPVKAKKTIKELKAHLKKADEVVLATDEDREGEAIAWHLIQALDLTEGKNIKRIVFHEITKSAIEEALTHSRELDINLVDAQQGRRVLDRLVGYELSPFLWRKLYKGLSAGRVQSVAVRLIVEREEEIRKFKPEEYWTIEALLKTEKNEEFAARLAKQNGKTINKLDIKSQAQANEISKNLGNAQYKVEAVSKKEIKRMPGAPFTTSTLQQEAWRKLRFSAKQTMMNAQQLYEGIALGAEGSVGLITYMRTDSTNLSAESLKKAKDVIKKEFGDQYNIEGPRIFKTKSKGAQEAHEAIRPTHPEKTPESIKDFLSPQQFKLYTLIWRRFIASQMQPAVFDSTSADISAGEFTFRASGLIRKFDGFLKAYPTKTEDIILPELKEKDGLDLIKLNSEQHFTEPPARYTDASLVKELEENGIGRPSTYAPTISTIQTRNYVEKNDQKRFQPTEIGEKVNKILVEHFPQIVDIEFTAKMEEKFDDISQGKTKWQPVIEEFYVPFHENLEKKYQEVQKEVIEEKTDEICEKCGKPMVIKQGRFGKFLACSGFPDCKNTKSIKKTTGLKCSQCNEGDIVEKRTKKKKRFWGCSRYPDCDYATWKDPTKKQKEKEEDETTDDVEN